MSFGFCFFHNVRAFVLLLIYISRISIYTHIHISIYSFGDSRYLESSPLSSRYSLSSSSSSSSLPSHPRNLHHSGIPSTRQTNHSPIHPTNQSTTYSYIHLHTFHSIQNHLILIHWSAYHEPNNTTRPDTTVLCPSLLLLCIASAFAFAAGPA